MGHRKINIERVAALNFRNYNVLSVPLSLGWTVLFGENGAGKTNFIEMVVLALQGVSFRGKLSGLINWATVETKIVVDLDSGTKISCHITTDGNRAKNERVLDDHVTEIVEGVLPPVVLFLPQEEYLLNSASGRRKILSRGLILQSQVYRQHFAQYVRLLRQRNSLLKLGGWRVNNGELDAWTESIVEPMLHIWEIRRKFVDALNEKLPDVLKDLGGINLGLRAELVFGGMPPEAQTVSYEMVMSRFVEVLQRETEFHTTMIGPHRDALRFVREDRRDVLPLLSRGQRRLLLLALHIIEGQYAADFCGIEPVYLLDDVFSELDVAHRTAIETRLKSRQVIATTADKGILPGLPLNALYYEVSCGGMRLSKK